MVRTKRSMTAAGRRRRASSVSRKRRNTTKGKNAKTSRRRMMAVPSSLPKPRNRRDKKPSSTSMVTSQLAVYKNPFSTATTQPKIPDGRTNLSLGLSNQTAGELVCNQSGATGGALAGLPENGVMHILLYGGQNTGAVVFGSQNGAVLTNNLPHTDFRAAVKHLGFAGSSYLSALSGIATTGGAVLTNNGYAQWRLVSQALKLGMLNPSEYDDGWWESIHITEQMDTSEYILHSSVGADNLDDATLSPSLLLQNPDRTVDLVDRPLANEPTFQTGLLRDIHKTEFKLCPTHKDHEFKQQSGQHTFVGKDISEANVAANVSNYVTFNTGEDDVREFINSWIDESYDMVYIRIHGRPGTTNPTRLHYNLVSNQEVVFQSGTRESRFMSKTADAGKKVEDAKTDAQDSAMPDNNHRRP